MAVHICRHHRQLFQNLFLNLHTPHVQRLDVSSFHSSICKKNAHKHWNKAVSAAEKVVGYPTSFMNLRFWLSDEMSNVAVNMRKLIGTKHPLMKTAKGLLFDNKENMQTRGLVVLLLSKAGGYPEHAREFTHHPLDQSYSAVCAQPMETSSGNGILSTQRSLAEITEMINTAFVLHKGVMDIDLSDRKKPFDSDTEDLLYGNKMALLSGDYLLAKASSGLAALGNTYVVEIMASAISDLMQSGFVESELDSSDAEPTLELWETWAYKNGASLYAKSCQSALMLSEHPEDVSEKAYEFGRCFGFLRQMRTEVEEARSVGGICDHPLSLNNILSDEEVQQVQEKYIYLAINSISQLPNVEARKALVNVVHALSANIS